MRRSWLTELSSAERRRVRAAQRLGVGRRGGQLGALQRDRALIQQGRDEAFASSGRRPDAFGLHAGDPGPSLDALQRPEGPGWRWAGCRSRRRRARPSPRPSARRPCPRRERVSSAEGRRPRWRCPRPFGSQHHRLAARRRRRAVRPARRPPPRPWRRTGQAALADSTAAMADARREVGRAWSRTRPVSQPVVMATTKNTSEGEAHRPAWPMLEGQPRLQEEEVVDEGRRAAAAVTAGQRPKARPATSTLSRKIIARLALWT